MKTHAFRLKPGMDLRQEIDNYVSQHNIKAACILTCVGNLSNAILRMADAKVVKEYKGSFEIVSLVGTMESGNSHLHISLSDKDGNVFGGHLKQGSIVGVTAEIVIGELENLEFTRTLDADTGYDELVVA
jgi:predicted DNA-binding protein with PD1-like motif